jgi:hypothetical protein
MAAASTSLEPTIELTKKNDFCFDGVNRVSMPEGKTEREKTA